MREVAALAGVSLKTVSRVINAEPAVSETVRSRVVGAIQRLDYRHNHAASSLRRSDRKSSTIGVLLEDVANPFSSALHREIEDVALQRGVLVLAGSSDEDQAREQQLIAAFTSRRVDGLIIVPASHDHSYLLSERRAGTSMVFVDRPPAFLDADSILTDNQAGVRQGIAHLIAHNHRRIGYLGDLMTITTAAERCQGYEQELASAGIALDPQLVRLNVHGIDKADAATVELLGLREPPTALFTSQNLLTIGASRALHRLDLHHRTALVGFDDVLLADLLDPGITVIAQDPSTMGRKAAEQLFRRIDGDQSPSVHLVVPTRLITRGSGEIRQ
ncbi:MAG: LacI family transcriptional regulator [Chloroflexi bacterium]|nr:MAG: LacI family transcriptional regulator [Chloroflexota bacterium]